MPFEYTFFHPEEIGTPECPDEFTEIRKMEERHEPAFCPVCGISCKKGVDRCSFNTVFPGSTRAEFLAGEAVKESVRAQDEGFRSKTELEVAMGQAEDRAKQLGVPTNRILGEKKSPFVGERYRPPADVVRRGETLVKQMIEAQNHGKTEAYMKAKKELEYHENHVRQEVAKVKAKQEFKPDKTRNQLKKEIKQSQSLRPGYA